MTQDLYALIFASDDPYNPGSLPSIQWHTTLTDAQNGYDAAIANTFNFTYAQILQVSATVVQATDGSPSGQVPA
jgi:hypothetical protein